MGLAQGFAAGASIPSAAGGFAAGLEAGTRLKLLKERSAIENKRLKQLTESSAKFQEFIDLALGEARRKRDAEEKRKLEEANLAAALAFERSPDFVGPPAPGQAVPDTSLADQLALLARPTSGMMGPAVSASDRVAALTSTGTTGARSFLPGGFSAAELEALQSLSGVPPAADIPPDVSQALASEFVGPPAPNSIEELAALFGLGGRPFGSRPITEEELAVLMEQIVLNQRARERAAGIIPPLHSSSPAIPPGSPQALQNFFDPALQ